jgi:osmoprotectant transport system ATP-binding protein
VAAIEFQHVSKQFPGAARPAVEDSTFSVAAGEFVVFLGPSGCGKTTLLKMVNRLYEPTSGTILVEGQDVRSLPPETLRRGIGYVIQQTGLFPHMTVARNIAVVPRLLGWTEAKIAERVDSLLTLIGLPPADYRDRYPSQLSGGQQQRVGLARALAADPHLMLMDEPFGAIDAITRTRLQGELLDLQRQLHKTILFVTHDVEEALRLADRIVIMRDGRVVQYDTPFNILTQPADQFVRDLVDADDTLRQLSQVRVATAMMPATGSPPIPPTLGGEGVAPPRVGGIGGPTGTPMLSPDDDLRSALSLMLRTGADSLPVVDQGQVVGVVSLDYIRARAGHEQDLTGF